MHGKPNELESLRNTTLAFPSEATCKAQLERSKDITKLLCDSGRYALICAQLEYVDRICWSRSLSKYCLLFISVFFFYLKILKRRLFSWWAILHICVSCLTMSCLLWKVWCFRVKNKWKGIIFELWDVNLKKTGFLSICFRPYTFYRDFWSEENLFNETKCWRRNVFLYRIVCRMHLLDFSSFSIIFPTDSVLIV